MDSSSNSRWKRRVFLTVSGVLTVAVMVVAHSVMLPFIMAALIAYVLMPLVRWVERRRVSRGAAIIVVYAVVLGTLGLFIRGITPRVAHEISNFRRELPSIAATVRDTWIPMAQERLRVLGLTPPAPAVPVDKPESGPSGIVARRQPDGSYSIDVGSGLSVKRTKDGYLIADAGEPKPHEPFDVNRVISEATERTFMYARHNALELAMIGRQIVTAISRTIFVFFITLMLAAYMMLTRERIIVFFESLLRPSARKDFGLLLVRVDRGLSGVVRGQIIICLINGVLSAVGFAVVGLKYWPVVALIATVFSLIPIFGAIISSVPAVALGLTQSLGTAAFVLAWIVVVHQIEANLLNPKIMGDAAKIHPVLVIFSLLVGEHFFQVIGALLAVPCMSIAQSIFLHIRYLIQRQDEEFAAEPVSVSSAPPSHPPRLP